MNLISLNTRYKILSINFKDIKVNLLYVGIDPAGLRSGRPPVWKASGLEGGEIVASSKFLAEKYGRILP